MFRAELPSADESPSVLCHCLLFLSFMSQDGNSSLTRNLSLKAELNNTSKMENAVWDFWLLRHCASNFAPATLIMEREAEDKNHGMGQCGAVGMGWNYPGKAGAGRNVITAFQRGFPRGWCKYLQQPESKRKLEKLTECITVLFHCYCTAGLWRQTGSREGGFVVCVEVSGKV